MSKQSDLLRNLNPKHVDATRASISNTEAMKTENTSQNHMFSFPLPAVIDRGTQQTPTLPRHEPSQLARPDLSHEYCAGIRLRLLPLLHNCTSPFISALKTGLGNGSSCLRSNHTFYKYNHKHM